MSSRPDPFWLCHECNSQMRPVTVDGVPQCAVCHGEFLEILDSEVNPDPYHELPHPPTRPQTSPPASSDIHAHDAHAYQDGGGFFQSLMGNFLGAAMDDRQDHTEGYRSTSMPSSPGSSGRNTGTGRGGRAVGSGASGSGGSGGSGLRTWEFNIGGGRGSVQFGTIGGLGGNGGMGPFGPTGGNNDDRGLDDFFPGFGMPPNAEARREFNPYRDAREPHAQRQGQGAPPWQAPGGGPASLEDMLQTLFGALGADGMAPGVGGPRGQTNFGDYVMTQNGFDEILEQLMHAAGPQGPIPASDVVIEGLPRFSLTEESLEKSQFKDCPVCKDDFSIGEEVMKIPCGHLFHPDCLQPWLKTNGSCPVCRFSLVPDQSNRPAQTAPATATDATSTSQPATSPPTPSQAPADGQNVFTNVLQRLWGQSGTSNPSSPIAENGPSGSSTFAPRPSTSRTPSGLASNLPHSGVEYSDPVSPPPTGPDLSSGIPEDYRERHRQREQQQYQQQQQQQQGQGSRQQQQPQQRRPPPPDDDYPSQDDLD